MIAGTLWLGRGGPYNVPFWGSLYFLNVLLDTVTLIKALIA